MFMAQLHSTFECDFNCTGSAAHGFKDEHVRICH
uniref:Uncharacterized protein n=1 Tax=Anguilla anguilla TaxID=7936 RepID=A0A0E9UPI6_ANGAN